MKRMLKILAIVVVLVLVGTYLIYVLDYKGNYNLKADVTLNVDENGGVSLTDFSYDSEPTSVVQFWDLFRGAGESTSGAYKMYWMLNYSGTTFTNLVAYEYLSNGESLTISAELQNLPVGSAVLTMTVTDVLGTSLYVKSYAVVVG